MAPLDPSPLIAYHPTELEHDMVSELTVPPLDIMALNFMDPLAYVTEPEPVIRLEDERLLQSLEVMEQKAAKQSTSVRSLAPQASSASKDTLKPSEESQLYSTPRREVARPRPEVSWLRRTEYISTEFGRSKGPSKVQESNSSAPALALTLEELFERIDKSFDQESFKRLQHPTNPTATIIQSISILPDLDNAEKYAHFVLDGPGLPAEEPDSRLRSSRALLKAMSNPADRSDTFIWYYVPEPSLEVEGKMKYVRAYNTHTQKLAEGQYWAMLMPNSDDTSQEENESSRALLAEINAQFILKKRRAKDSGSPWPFLVLNRTDEHALEDHPDVSC